MNTATETSPEALEQAAVRLAVGAAELARAHRDAGVTVSSKSTATDLVTESDRAVERWLRTEIAARRPGDAVLGEEGGGLPGRSGVRWVLDPIDGTVNYVLGLPLYAVSVAAEVDGTVVAGAVCNPASGELFHARSGGGAWLRPMYPRAGDADGGATPLNAGRSVPLTSAVVGTGFGYESAMRARQAGVVAALLPRVGDIRRLGAASLDLCAVAAGRLDGYFEAGLNLWDFAAGGLVAAEAGCVLSGLRGQAPSRRLVAVAWPGCAVELFALLERLGADEVSSRVTTAPW